MVYMVIEHFRAEKLKELYQRYEAKGRMLPEGVHYVNSWIDENVNTCYQVMESESKQKLLEWVNHWSDLADFEIIPVISSAEAKQRAMSRP